MGRREGTLVGSPLQVLPKGRSPARRRAKNEAKEISEDRDRWPVPPGVARKLLVVSYEHTESTASLARAGAGETDQPPDTKEDSMSVAKVSEISATSTQSFQDAIDQGITRANKTLRNVKSAWIKEQQIRVTEGRITEYQVNMMLTFVIDD